MRFSRFLRNSFLRLLGAAFAPAAAGAAASCGFSFAILLLPSQPQRLKPLESASCTARLKPCPYENLYLRAIVFFFAATAPLRGPLRVRALVCVRWPRTGRLR